MCVLITENVYVIIEYYSFSHKAPFPTMASDTATAAGEAGILVASKRVVYVGGLADDVSPQILRSAMIPFGNIKSLDIPMDYKVGKTRGFAFVEFDDPEDGTYYNYSRAVPDTLPLFGNIVFGCFDLLID